MRDKDIRVHEVGESIDEKNRKLSDGLKNHYKEVCLHAEKLKKKFEAEGYKDIPVIGMGHLFAAGGETVEGDGVRELYVGTLSHVGTDAFPEVLDYVALGHLHVAQLVGKKEHIRYSGSPIPMGFGEAKQKKIVILLEFDGGNLKMTDIEVPVFQRLEKLGGDLDYICKEIDKLKKKMKAYGLRSTTREKMLKLI